MKEIWKNVVGFEGIYLVSNMGNVFSVGRNVKRTVKGKTWKYYLKPKMLKKLTGSDHYHFVCLWKNKKPRQYRISRLVLAAFIGPCPEGNYCNHKNGIRTDNRISNLEWCTPSENNFHSYRVLKNPPVVNRGEKSSSHKITEKQARQLLRLRQANPDRWPYPRIMDKFGLSKSQVARIVKRQSWEWLDGSPKFVDKRTHH